jgi:DNA-3-methyladenine glycosylase I
MRNRIQFFKIFIYREKLQMTINRCSWGNSHPLYIKYHDNEWGVPLHDDQKLFEFLILEGVQAGLSWLTVLKKRDNYRIAFDNFDARKVATYDDDKIQELLADDGIIRNKLKINSARTNARIFILTQKEFGSFSSYIWGFVNHEQVQNSWTDFDQVPAETEESRAMSKDMKKRGFKFVGPTICYAFMQAAGLVNDHIVGCFRYQELKTGR